MNTTPNKPATHTAGPWHVGMNPGPMVYGPKGEQVADCRNIFLDGSEAGHNARLIAQAPALAAENAKLREALADVASFINALAEGTKGLGDIDKRSIMRYGETLAHTAKTLDAKCKKILSKQ